MLSGYVRYLCVLILSVLLVNSVAAEAPNALGANGKITTLNVVSKLEALKNKAFSPPFGKKGCVRYIKGENGFRPIKSFLFESRAGMDQDGKIRTSSRKTNRKLRALCRKPRSRKRSRAAGRKVNVLQIRVQAALVNLPTPLVGAEETSILPVFSEGDGSNLEIYVVDAKGGKVEPLAGTKVVICGLISSVNGALCEETKAGTSSIITPVLPTGEFKDGYTFTFEQPGSVINKKFSVLPAKITLKQVPVEPIVFEAATLKKQDMTLKRHYTRPSTGEIQAVEVTFKEGTQLKTEDGKQYTGKVEARVQYIDSLSADLPPMRANDNGNSARLVSLGMGRVQLQTAEGSPLTAVGENASITFPFPSQYDELKGKNRELKDQFELWILNTDTGVWERPKVNSASAGILAGSPENPVTINEENKTASVELPPASVTDEVVNVDRAEMNIDGACLGVRTVCTANPITIKGYVQNSEEIQPLPVAVLEMFGSRTYVYSDMIDGTVMLEWEYANPGALMVSKIQEIGGPSLYQRQPVPNPIPTEVSAQVDCPEVVFFCTDAGSGIPSTPSNPPAPGPSDPPPPGPADPADPGIPGPDPDKPL